MDKATCRISEYLLDDAAVPVDLQNAYGWERFPLIKHQGTSKTDQRIVREKLLNSCTDKKARK